MRAAIKLYYAPNEAVADWIENSIGYKDGVDNVKDGRVLMKNIKKGNLGISLVAFMLLSPPLVQGEVISSVSNFMKLNWTVSENSKETMNDLSSEDVNRFINELLGDEDNLGKIGSFKFEDLGGDGQYELLGSIDYSGRAFYKTLVVINKINDKFKFQKFWPYNIYDLDKITVDLNGDSKKEIVIEKDFITSIGGRRATYWTDIYKYKNGEYVIANREFLDFYKGKIPDLEREIEKTNDPEKRSTYEIEVDKIQRLLNPGSHIGLKRAKKYLDTHEKEWMRKAVDILEDIGDAEAIDLLKATSKQPDRYISKRANRALERIDANKKLKK